MENISEYELYDKLTTKINTILKNIDCIKLYTLSNKNPLNIEYISKMNEVSTLVNTLLAYSNDMTNIYLSNTAEHILNNEDANRVKEYNINKKIETVFLPYMLYMQIILQNN